MVQIVSNWIGGKYVTPSGGLHIDNIGPATGEIIAKIPRSDAAVVAQAVDAAKGARTEWGLLSIEERADWLDKIADCLEARKEEIALLESKDTGKPVALARMVDATRSIENFRFFAKFGRERKPETYEMADAMNTVVRKPIGIVGLVTPWNLPLYLLSWKVAPALLMGNCIVAKPSELTPLTADLLGRVLTEDVGLPAGVVNIVHGFGHEVGQAIVEHPDIEAISFTGGTATGKIVARTAAPMFKKISLELGGKNASIVMADADLDVAVPGVVRAGFANQGQVCLCGSRILVADEIWDQFVPKFVEKVNAMTVGDPATCNMGAVISFQHREKIESYIEIAKTEGGEVLTGGTRPDLPGAFIRPTVISGTDIKSRVATEEIFGPVVTLHRFKGDDEMVEMANATQYGLCCSIWTKDTAHASKIGPRIDVGICWINCWLHRDLRTPFGGVKQSGVGREGGDWSLGFFSEPQNVCVKYDASKK